MSFDRYRVVRELGRGGAAIVYEAVHKGLGTRVALKWLSLQSDAVKQRMMTEARLQASLKHPNLVAVTDIFEVDGRPVVILDLVDGPTLERSLIDDGLPSHDEAERIFRGIVAGVAAAHAKGVVHRDLKPANVMMEDGEPRVTDFGLAKALANPKGQTKMGVAMGTPGFMAPELVDRANTADERADIFSLGCILYVMVGGRIAFSGANVLEALKSTTEGRYTPLLELAPDTPDRLVRVVDACLQTDRELRPRDCAALLRMLDQGRPVRAPGPHPVAEERPPPSLRRVAGAALLLAGMALLAWLANSTF